MKTKGVESLKEIAKRFVMNNISRIPKMTLNKELRDELFWSLKNSGVLDQHHIELFMEDEFISEVDFSVPWKRVNISDQALEGLAMRAIAKGGAKWQRISLEGCKTITARTVKCLLQSCVTTLTSLDIRRTDLDPEVYSTVGTLRNLKQLYCSSTFNDTAATKYIAPMIGKQLTDLWIAMARDLTMFGIETLLLGCPNLQVLNLDKLNIAGNANIANAIANSLPNLRELSMRYLSYSGYVVIQRTGTVIGEEDKKGDTFVRPILWNCKKLEILDIIGMPDFTGNAFFCDKSADSYTGAPSTTDTSLASASFTPSPFGSADHPFLHNLSQLNIQATDVTDLSLKHILRVCPSLMAINVANCPKLTFGREEGVETRQYAWNQSKNLRKIELSDDLGLEKALQECPRLSHLSCCYMAIDAEQEHMCKFDKVTATSLTTLSLIYCFKMANLDKLLPQLPNLVHLDLCDMVGVTEEFMLSIANNCPLLEHLNLSNSKIEETMDWKKVLSSFSSLRELCVNYHSVTESLLALQDDFPHINIHL